MNKEQGILNVEFNSRRSKFFTPCALPACRQGRFDILL